MHMKPKQNKNLILSHDALILSHDASHCAHISCLHCREFYVKEKHRVQEQLNRMDEDLRLTRATLRKELDWKDKMDGNYKNLISEKRDLLSQYVDVFYVL